MKALVAFCMAVTLVACKFPELAPVDEDAGIDAADESCVDIGLDSPDPSCPAERPICVDGLCGGRCDADADCGNRTDGNTVCLEASGACVGCDEDGLQADPGSAEDECPTTAAPVCDAATHTCRACAAHTECSSRICVSGACIDQSNVIYLNTAGSDVGECTTPTNGCLTLQYAVTKLTPARRYMFFVPSTITYITATDNSDAGRFYQVDAHLVGYGAKLGRYNNNAALNMDNSNVIVEGLTITSSGGDGVDCGGGSLVIRDMRIEGANGVGIRAGCTFTMTNSSVVNNNGGGIDATSGAVYKIVNNWIINNGSATSSMGGVRLSSASTQAYFQFNTVAYNRSGFDGDGIHCYSPTGTINNRNNIVIGTAGAVHLATNGQCFHEYTLVSPDNGAPGTGNMVISDPQSFMFVDMATYDYHLRPGSVAIGRGDASTLPPEAMFDIDGELRAAGSTEVGADEIP